MNSFTSRLPFNPGIHGLLRVSLAFGLVGWLILCWIDTNLPFLPVWGWRAGAVVCSVLAARLVWNLHTSDAVRWMLFVGGYGSLRSFAYIDLDAWSPLGVWILVISGLFATVLAVVMMEQLLEMTKK